MNSLNDADVAASLERLHAGAAGDAARRAARDPNEPPDDSLTRRGDMYLAVSRAEGQLLYLLARGSHAQRMVEFGASFGVSTTYLAAAARDNGGRLVTTEAHPGKCAATRQALGAAGLDGVVTLLEGDARETLQDVEGPVDFVFLDGWKSMYLPVLELLIPKLVDGTLIAADNIDHEGAQSYAEHVKASTDFVSHTLGKMELSCWTPSRAGG